MKTYGNDAQLNPGLESQHIRITDEWVDKRVNELVAARKAVIQAESETRVKYSLHNKANTLPEIMKQGDMVQYYRELCVSKTTNVVGMDLQKSLTLAEKISR